jgi:hypothetical protein
VWSAMHEDVRDHTFDSYGLEVGTRPSRDTGP